MEKNKKIYEDFEKIIIDKYEEVQENSSFYATEYDLEKGFIDKLQSLGFDYEPSIKNEQKLIENLRKQIEILNDIKFSDSEWERFFYKYIANDNENYIQKIQKIQLPEKRILYLKGDNGEELNIKLVEKRQLKKNKLQVINQFSANDKKRYDVTILINGLPMVQIELKKPGTKLKDAFNQIAKYTKSYSDAKGSKLFEYLQIFIISDGIQTKYYSNTTRVNTIKRNQNWIQNKQKANNNFKFTFFWSDKKNKKIFNLIDFAQYFLGNILKIIFWYCVLDSKNNLLVLRSYQIHAIEEIISRILKSGLVKDSFYSNGFIWHSTGSGKTLTSFKAANLIKQLFAENNNIDPELKVEKIFFVVDRKDLDKQTTQEFNRFERGSVDETTNVSKLRDQIQNPKVKIIVTTIQKLNLFLTSKRFNLDSKKMPIFTKKVIFIFDECHRSQFGEMNKNIASNFKNKIMFGFTGTPIFKWDKGKLFSVFGDNSHKTTQARFNKALSIYNMYDAIKDENVLSLYHEGWKPFEGSQKPDAKVFSERRWISTIVKRILEKDFWVKTKNIHRNKKNFNGMIAVDSIESAKIYYEEFQSQMAKLVEKDKSYDLKIWTIFSYSSKKDPSDEDKANVKKLHKDDQEFLKKIIRKYNQVYKTNFSEDPSEFYKFHGDISEKMKQGKIDILIVVNMFLTGFNCPILNTIWIDKNIESHNLIQAISRTNRLSDGFLKDKGNFITFRNMKETVDQAMKDYCSSSSGETALFNIDEKIDEHQKKTSILKSKFNYQEYKKDPFSHDKKYYKECSILFSQVLALQSCVEISDKFQKMKEKGCYYLEDKDIYEYKSLLRNQDLREMKEEPEEGQEKRKPYLDFEDESIRYFDNYDKSTILKLIIDKFFEDVIFRKDFNQAWQVLYPRINTSFKFSEMASELHKLAKKLHLYILKNNIFDPKEIEQNQLEGWILDIFKEELETKIPLTNDEKKQKLYDYVLGFVQKGSLDNSITFSDFVEEKISLIIPDKSGKQRQDYVLEIKTKIEKIVDKYKYWFIG